MGPAPMRNDSRTTSTKAGEFRRIEVITGVGRRRRWTDEEKAWIGAEGPDPAGPGPAVARRYGLHPSQLFVWRQRLAAPATREAPGFVPVVVAEDDPAPARTAGRGGIRLRPAGRGAGWRSRAARRWCGSGRTWTPRRCAGCSRWCGAWRDRGPAGGAHPARDPAGRLPQGHGRAGGPGAAGPAGRSVRRGGLHLPPQAWRPGEDPGL